MAGRELDGRGGRGVELGRERRSLQAEGVEGRLLVGGGRIKKLITVDEALLWLDEEELDAVRLHTQT